MKKQVIVLLLTAALLAAAAFTGCGSGGSNNATGNYSNLSLSGAWLMDTTADRGEGYDFFITDGNGTITSNSFYSVGTGTYAVQSNGAFSLYTSAVQVTGTLTSPTTGNLSTVGLTNSTISKVSDLTLCQGTWSGALSTGYDLNFTIKADGTLDSAATNTITGGTITNGVMVGQGDLCVGYFTTNLTNPYNAFRINGTLATGATTTISGEFNNDSADAWPVGTVSLTKVPTVTTYTSTDVPKSIPDCVGGVPGSAASTLTVSGGVASIAKVTVTLNITHTWDNDLDIYLVSPQGTQIMLSTNNGVGGENYTNTVFDDFAASSITTGIAPFTGTYQPEAALAGLIGQNANGTWTLRVYDDWNGDTGTLNSWSITIQ